MSNSKKIFAPCHLNLHLHPPPPGNFFPKIFFSQIHVKYPGTKFFCFILMKISYKLCDRMDGTQFLCFPLVSSKFLAMRNITLYSALQCMNKVRWSIRLQVKKALGKFFPNKSTGAFFAVWCPNCTL